MVNKTMYRTSFGTKIEALEVVKETEKMLTYTYLGKAYTEGKWTNYQQWHETHKDAVHYLKTRLESKIESIKKDLEQAESNLIEFKKSIEAVTP